ncbi:MAG: hypothetical protein P8P81_04690 [Bacteroidia bacterium]|jgi:hypothetical protein|nr:hypothetical protein [Bacteroidia bacterium]
MIYNTTRTDKNIDLAVNELVGKRFGIFHKLKNGSIGSEPFIIQSCSLEFDINFDSIEYNRKCNIELRPNGIIVHFRKNSSSFIWPIPFRHLTVYKSGQILSIYENTIYLKLKPKVNRKNNSPFILRLLNAKSSYTQLNHQF